MHPDFLVGNRGSNLHISHSGVAVVLWVFGDPGGENGVKSSII